MARTSLGSELFMAVASVATIPAEGATVQVNLRTGGAATVYTTEMGATTTGNPLTVDSLGRIAGWLDEGSYDLVVSANGRNFSILNPTRPFEAASGATVKVTFVPSGFYRTLLNSSGSHTAARVAGTYAMGQGDPLAITGTGTLYPLNSLYIDSADYPVVGPLGPRMRVKAQLYTNDVAPGSNFVVGLHPITRPATSGGAGLAIYTVGAAVAGSTTTFTAPLVDAILAQVGADFALPANGHYVIGVVTSGAIAASAHVHMTAQLQMRNV